MVRKSIEELREEGEENDDQANDSPQSGDAIRSEAVTETEREEFNELFDLLNSNGYMTLGDYSLQYDDEYEMQVVTFSAALPSSNDWDPSIAYDDDE